MKLGIVGLPNVGKTTLFNALTHAQAAATAYAFTSAESNLGVVAVPDPRLDRLDEVLETPKKVNATIDLVDIAGLAEGASRGEGLGNRFLSDIRGVDAVAHVVRTFENPEVAHVSESLDPRADVDLVETELVLSDAELVERRLDKTRKAARSGDKAARHELEVLEALHASLMDGELAKRFERAAADEPLFRELALVSDRPMLFVLNTDDDQSAAAALEQHAEFVEWARGRGDQVVAVAARLEAELADLEPEEAAEFRAELGADEAGTLDVVLRACYEVLGYITLLHRRLPQQRVARLATAPRLDRQAGRGPHPQRHRARVRARPGRAHRGPHRAGVVPRGAREGAAAHRGQGVRRPGRRRDQLHAHRLTPGAHRRSRAGPGEAAAGAQSSSWILITPALACTGYDSATGPSNHTETIWPAPRSAAVPLPPLSCHTTVSAVTATLARSTDPLMAPSSTTSRVGSPVSALVVRSWMVPVMSAGVDGGAVADEAG